MNMQLILDNLPTLLWGAYPNGPLGGLALTLLLASLAGLGSALLGVAGGVALTMWQGWPKRLLAALVGFLRAIPVLMLIFWAYFLLPILFGVDIPEIATVVAALAMIGGAYLAHGVAAGLAAVGRGQWQAGLSLGLTRWQTLRLVALPQALRMMLPSFVNQWVALIKDTSLAYIVGVSELTYVATQLNNRTLVYPTEVFLFVGLMYFLLCSSLQLAVAHWSRCLRVA